MDTPRHESFEALRKALDEINPTDYTEQSIKYHIGSYLDDISKCTTQEQILKETNWDNAKDLLDNFIDETHEGAFSGSELTYNEWPYNSTFYDAEVEHFFETYRTLGAIAEYP